MVPTVLSIDETYLWKRYDVLASRHAKSSGSVYSIIGGAWPNDADIPAPRGDENSDLDLDLDLDPAKLAPMMMDFVLKRADFHDSISVAHVPIAQKGLNGITMMSMTRPIVQSLLDESKVGVICIAHDHAPHSKMLNSFLLGQPLPHVLQQDPFWSTGAVVSVDGGSGTWPFAARAFPRKVHAVWQVVFGGTDPNHCLKIMAAQMRTTAKTIRLADLHVDCTASLAYGMPIASYQESVFYPKS